MNYSQKRAWVRLRNNEDYSLRINPFVFSRSFFLWALVGLMGGVIAGLYWIVLEFMTETFHFFTGIWVIPLMAVAGLLAGLVIHLIGDPGEIQLIVNNIRFKGGRLEPKNNVSMILSSLLCISVGGSLGPEAPLVQVTGSTGSWLAQKLRLKGEAYRSLSIAGMASGFTALFGAPLGGSLFSLEILHHKYVVEYYRALIPAFVASCSAYLIFILITHIGIGPVWDFPVYQMSSLFDFFYAVVFSLAAVAVGWLFIFLVRTFKKMFALLKAPIYVRTAIGGLILGVCGYYFPVTRFFGHEEINTMIESDYGLYMLLVILFVKLFAITITVTSGWRGGFIIPLFFIGSTIGLVLFRIFPDINFTLAAICCMAAINACVTRTPISTIILLASLTGFSYFVPIMFAALTGFFLAPKLPFISTQLTRNDHE